MNKLTRCLALIGLLLMASCSKENGWIVTDNNNGFTIEAQRQNALVSMLIYLASDNKDGSATVEYYEDSDTPTFTKQITWSGGWPHY